MASNPFAAIDAFQRSHNPNRRLGPADYARGVSMLAPPRPVPTPPAQQSAFVPDGSTISSYTPTLGERLGNLVSSGAQALGYSRTYADKIRDDAAAVTPLGAAMMVGDGLSAINRGHPWSGAGQVALGAIGAAPGMGEVEGAAVRGLERRAGGMFANVAERAPIRAWHGSPHNFDAFDMSKIGTGEGAQAYGHGLYFAENPDVARGYRDTLASSRGLRGPDGMLYEPDEVPLRGQDLRQNTAARLLTDHGSPEAVRAHLAQIATPATLERTMGDVNSILDAGYQPNPGHLYEVNINADPASLLDWDAPEWQQPATVRDLLREAGRGANLTPPEPRIRQTASGRFSAMNTWGETIGTYQDRATAEARSLAALHRPFGGMGAYHALGGNALYSSIDGGDASRRLLEAGVPGIQYFDAGSRASGLGTRNYVMFDPSLIDIVGKH